MPYQKAKAYDVYIKKKAIPVEMLAEIACLIAMHLTFSIFLVPERKKLTKKPQNIPEITLSFIVYMHKFLMKYIEDV